MIVILSLADDGDWRKRGLTGLIQRGESSALVQHSRLELHGEAIEMVLGSQIEVIRYSVQCLEVAAEHW